MRRPLALLCTVALMACAGGDESSTPGTAPVVTTRSSTLPPGSAPATPPPDAGTPATDDGGPVAAEDARLELVFTGDDAIYIGDREIVEGQAEVVLVNESSEPIWFVIQYFERGSAALDLDRHPEGVDFVSDQGPAGDPQLMEPIEPGRVTRSIVLQPGTFIVEAAKPGEEDTHVWRAAVIDVSASEDLDTPTDPVVLGEATIPVFNGTSALNRLLTWGIGRFEAAGLEPPELASVTFTRHSEFCHGAWAQTQATADGYELRFCFDEERACWDEACDLFVPAGRLAVLHELAHVWMYANLDDGARQRFTDHVGLTNWNDATIAWSQRGIERAADTIAWGLMDREMRMLAIGDPSRADLESGFRLLTGAEPLPRTDDYSSTDLPVALE